MKKQTYDYVIVGGGSAGCVLANRLTEDPTVRVLLLEAGGRDFDPLIHVPLGMAKMHEHHLHDWGYSTDPVPGLDGRTLEKLRGKVLGGSSSVNFMAHVRGNPGDYDRWARTAAPGWSFADVLPYFKRSETWEDGESALRGGNGPVGVQWARTPDPLFDAWIEAAKAAGIPHTPDYNGAQQVGFGRAQFAIRNGHRSSAAAAFLRPAMKRPNLTVLVRALGHRVLLNGPRAIGVEYSRHGQTTHAYADREVILSGGAFNTPHVLMLSGIGPADHLRAFGIQAVADLPVGQNLQDHLSVMLQLSRPVNTSRFRDDLRFDRIAVHMIRAYLFGTGPASAPPGGLQGFVKLTPDSAVPDLQFLFRGAPLDAGPWFPGVKPAYADGFSIQPVLLHPQSRGELRLRSADPRDRIRIAPNYFSVREDMITLREGVKLARTVAHQTPLDRYRSAELDPGPDVKTDDAIEAWIRRTTHAVHHPSCTCAMGTGPHTVLDTALNVRGVDALRVVDASAMVDLVSGNTNACVYMMAERAADLIRGRAPLPAAVARAPAAVATAV